MSCAANTVDETMLLPKSETYKEAGVDTQEAETGLQRLTQHIMKTWPKAAGTGNVKLPIGYFANVIDFFGTGLALCTDGVGSKAIIAQEMQKYDTIGIDCVAMNVNDLICVGARPLSMVDYISVDRADSGMLEEISIGLSAGAAEAEISIPGGEIAQLKDVVKGFDIVGMAVGSVPLDKIIVGQDVEEGDVLIGIESNGIHSNGLSLARRAFFELNDYTVLSKFDELGNDIGSELLRPTHIYVREVMELLDRVQTVKALVNITSDGFLNLARIEAKAGFVIDRLPEIPPVFSLIQNLAHVEKAEMFEVYNMGIGFCAVVGESEADQALSILSGQGRKAFRIGYAVADEEKCVFLEQHGLKGRDKRFHPA